MDECKTRNSSGWFARIEEANELNVYPGGIYKDLSFPGEELAFWGLLAHPRCDLEIRPENEYPKASFLNFLPLIPIDVYCGKAALERAIKSPDKKLNLIRDGVADHLKDLAKGKVHRYALLPPEPDFDIPLCVLDFEKHTSIEIDDLRNYEVVCELAEPHKYIIQNDFARFYDRLGMQSISETSITEETLRIFDNIARVLSRSKTPSA